MKAINLNMKTKIMKTSILLALAIFMGAGAFASDKNQLETNATGAGSTSGQKLASTANSRINSAFLLEEAPEEKMVIEDWMINLKNDKWNTEKEEEIPLEKWMYDLSDQHWTNNSDEKEEDLKLEPWMLDLSKWKLQ